MSNKALLTLIFIVMALLALCACGLNAGRTMPGPAADATPAIKALAMATASTPDATATINTEPTIEPTATEVATTTPEPSPTVEPTPTSVSAGGWRRETPYTINEVAQSWAWRVKVQEVVRGDDAWAMLQAASPLNEPPPPGMQYILVRLQAASALSGRHAINHNDFALTGDRSIFYDHVPIIVPEPELDADLVRGEWTEGWLAFLAGQDEGQLMLIIHELLDIDLRFIALDEGAAINFDYSASWSMSPTDAGTTRANPAPPGSPVRTYDWEVTVTEVLRGEAAWAAVQGASPANEPPPEGMEYIAIKLSVWRWGANELPRWLNSHCFTLSGEDNILHPWQAVVAPKPALDVKVFPGGRYEGWIVKIARAGEEQLMLRFMPPYGLTTDTIRYLALSEDVSLTIPPELATSEPNGLGQSRAHPAPFGQTVITEDWELTVLEVVRGSEALALVPRDNPFNETPAPGMEFIAVKLRARYIATVDEPPGRIFDLDFSVISESNVTYDPPIVDEPEPALDVNLYPGGEYEGWMILQTREGSMEPVLVFLPFLPFSSPRAYYMSLVP